jgi:[pyruvate, water dikinase]-phosphate phosphotransferase / [pyruvate, water dikinase] kinase
MEEENKYPPIYIVSGGKGVAGHVMVQSTLIQFPDNKVPVQVVTDVITEEKLLETIETVIQTGGIVVHTMVNTDMRIKLIKLCHERNVKEIDLMGELSEYISNLINKEPVRIPGLFRKLNQEYFDRISSIEFALAHDDGLNPDKINNADVVLAGVSRAGKTPLCVYMAMFGWKVANIPIVKGMEPPAELFKIDPGRVFGLTLSMSTLITQRTKRLARMGNVSLDSYVEPREVREEIDYAESIFRRGGFTVIDVTNKPIESSSNEIVAYIMQRYPQNKIVKDN